MSDAARIQRDDLRHALATLAYRGGKAIRDAPAGFESCAAGGATRSAGHILAHIGDLLEWALSIAQDQQSWHDSTPRSWSDDTARFFDGLARLDTYLASDAPLGAAPDRLFQGPIADAFTHVGQIALLRRLAGSPIRGENYLRADIVAGRVGPEQTGPRREFE